MNTATATTKKLNPNLFWFDFVDNVYRNADENDRAYGFDEYYEACFGKGIETETTFASIREENARNFDALTTNTKTAREMALTSHNLSRDGKYARTADGGLFIWSDYRNAWVQIDQDKSGAI